MELETEDLDGARVVTVATERIDAASAIKFKDMMRSATEGGPDRVILNLERVDFVDSSGLGAVVSAMKLLGDERKLELAALTPKVERVFRLTRMDSVFRIHASVQDALSADRDVA